MSHVWLAIVVGLLIAASPKPARAKDCHRETPLPADARITAPAPTVPETVARFSGTCFFQIPYMSGLGGNLVALLPNGVSAFRFADALNYDPEAMIRAGETIRPFCASPPREALSATPERPRLTAGELRTELPGDTFQIGRLRMFLAPDGALYATRGNELDVGTWEIASDGRYCRTWNVWDDRRSRCYTVHRDGERFELRVQDRWGAVTLHRTRGNLDGH